MADMVPENAVTSNSTGGETDMVVTLPTHSEGDFLFIHIAQDQTDSTSFTNPAGWSTVVPYFQSSGATYKVIYKEAGASEPGTVTVVSDDSERFTAIAYRVSGCEAPETAASQVIG